MEPYRPDRVKIRGAGASSGVRRSQAARAGPVAHANARVVLDRARATGAVRTRRSDAAPGPTRRDRDQPIRSIPGSGRPVDDRTRACPGRAPGGAAAPARRRGHQSSPAGDRHRDVPRRADRAGRAVDRARLRAVRPPIGRFGAPRARRAVAEGPDVRSAGGRVGRRLVGTCACCVRGSRRTSRVVSRGRGLARRSDQGGDRMGARHRARHGPAVRRGRLGQPDRCRLRAALRPMVQPVR